jgi:hypothetical protein
MKGALQLNRKFVKDVFTRLRAVWSYLERNGTLVNQTFELTENELASLLRESLWASLDHDEGRRTSFVLVYGSSASGGGGYSFERPLPFNSRELVKLAPAVTRGELLIGAGRYPRGKGGHEIRIWGLAASLWSPISIATVGPGRIVLRVLWTPIAAISRERGILLRDVGDDDAPPASDEERANSSPDVISRASRRIALTMMVSAIREAGHGGALLVAPTREYLLRQRLNSKGEPDPWDGIIDSPLVYEARDGSLGLLPGAIRQVQRQRKAYAALDRQMPREERDGSVVIPIEGDLGNAYTKAHEDLLVYEAELVRAARVCAKSTEVDGAVILDRDLSVLAFGTKLVPIVRAADVKTLRRHPIEGEREKVIQGLDWLGGTRHQSAARFIYERPGWYAYVVSQDGMVTVMHRDTENNHVIVLRDAELLFP